MSNSLADKLRSLADEIDRLDRQEPAPVVEPWPEIPTLPWPPFIYPEPQAPPHCCKCGRVFEQQIITTSGQ